MTDNELTSLAPSNLGAMKIADQVVAIIAGNAATKVEGMAGMSGGIADGIAEKLGGKKNLSRGVKVETSDNNNVTIDIYIIVYAGYRIPQVVSKIQETVKENVDFTTGLNVNAINVHVQGIIFPEEEIEDEEGKPKQQ